MNTNAPTGPGEDLNSAIDRHFSRFIARFGGGETMEQLAAALSRAGREGHLCLNLSNLSTLPDLPSPAIEQALAACRAVGNPTAQTPLVNDQHGRLYLRRIFEDERHLAAALLERAGATPPGEGQQAAIAAAQHGRLVVITGGPGTGKTWTAIQILKSVLTTAPETRIALAAPTGKAAARLEETLRQGLTDETSQLPQLPQLPKARTLNALLGAIPGKATPRHHAGNPLPIDLLLLDEASMVALPLMAKLFDALPASARVILLGDRDQLASVEPGSVLADLVEALPGGVICLTENRRFGSRSGIGRASQSIRNGDAEQTISLLEEANRDNWPDLAWHPLPPPGDLSETLRSTILREYGSLHKAPSPAAALEQLSCFRLLCALRRGPYGVEGLNRLIDSILSAAGLITRRQGLLYPGLPIMVTQNDDTLGVRNGDIGIVWPHPSQSSHPSRLTVCFESQSGEVRAIPPARLPRFEPAYAMTVHKSQGSEFDRILLLLPSEIVPLVTRELIYTGITRARSAVTLWSNHEVLAAGIAQQVTRHSGLRDALRHPPSPSET